MNWKPDAGQQIERLYTWIAVEPDGGEGLMAGPLVGPGSMMPMIGADMERIESYRKIAIAFGQAIGVTIKLIEFSQCRELERHAPGEPE